MGCGIAAAAIYADPGFVIGAERGEARAQIVIRFEFSIGDIVAGGCMNRAWDMAGRRFCGIADIRGARASVEQLRLFGEFRGISGVDRRHMAWRQHHVTGPCGVAGDMV